MISLQFFLTLFSKNASDTKNFFKNEILNELFGNFAYVCKTFKTHFSHPAYFSKKQLLKLFRMKVFEQKMTQFRTNSMKMLTLK